MTKLVVNLAASTKKPLEQMSARAGIRTEELVALLLQSFVENDGRVYTGAWPEGPGVRLLPDWPRFSSGVMKIKTAGKQQSKKTN